MKNIKLCILLLNIPIVLFGNKILAQSAKKVPENITIAFIHKYPAAVIKKCDFANNIYTVNAKEHGHNFVATFNQNANWLSSKTKISWPWKLPPNIKAAYKKSKYKNWNIYSVNLIDMPAGQRYQINVNDKNRPIDIYHQNLVMETRTVEIKSDGTIVDENAEAQ